LRHHGARAGASEHKAGAAETGADVQNVSRCHAEMLAAVGDRECPSESWRRSWGERGQRIAAVGRFIDAALAPMIMRLG